MAVSQLPEAERFKVLNNRSKHFVDTIEIVSYRPETALAHILAETMHIHHRDEARGLARQIFANEANLRPDQKAGTLTVEIHSLKEIQGQRVHQALRVTKGGLMGGRSRGWREHAELDFSPPAPLARALDTLRGRRKCCCGWRTEKATATSPPFYSRE